MAAPDRGYLSDPVAMLIEKAAEDEKYLPTLLGLATYESIEMKYRSELSSLVLDGPAYRSKMANFIWAEIDALANYSENLEMKDYAINIIKHLGECWSIETKEYKEYQNQPGNFGWFEFNLKALVHSSLLRYDDVTFIYECRRIYQSAHVEGDDPNETFNSISETLLNNYNTHMRPPLSDEETKFRNPLSEFEDFISDFESEPEFVQPELAGVTIKFADLMREINNKYCFICRIKYSDNDINRILSCGCMYHTACLEQFKSQINFV